MAVEHRQGMPTPPLVRSILSSKIDSSAHRAYSQPFKGNHTVRSEASDASLLGIQGSRFQNNSASRVEIPMYCSEVRWRELRSLNPVHPVLVLEDPKVVHERNRDGCPSRVRRRKWNRLATAVTNSGIPLLSVQSCLVMRCDEGRQVVKAFAHFLISSLQTPPRLLL